MQPVFAIKPKTIKSQNTAVFNTLTEQLQLDIFISKTSEGRKSWKQKALKSTNLKR